MDDEFDDPETFAALQAAEASFSKSIPAQDARPLNTTPQPAPGKVQQPKPQALPQRALPSAIQVSTRQRGNPILNHISSMPWEYSDTPADYVLGQTTCALFLSLKYHRLHPEYLYSRIRGIAGKYNLRVLLVMVDIDAHEDPLKELAKTSLINNLTLILCWSAREAARYLEAYKALERADPSGIKGAKAAGFAEQMQEFVTTPRGVNKTDAVSLVSAFGSIRAAMNADREEIVMIPGWGEKKVERFVATASEPFRIGRTGKKVGREREGAGGEARRLGTLHPDELSSLGQSRGTPDPTATPATTGKRGRDELEGTASNEQTFDWDDDEEALFVAENPVMSGNQEQAALAPKAKPPRSEEPGLSEGIEAALAKLRK